MPIYFNDNFKPREPGDVERFASAEALLSRLEPWIIEEPHLVFNERGVILRLEPLLSGSCCCPVDLKLSWVVWRFWRWGVELIEASAMHEICADEAGEGEDAADRLGGLLCDAQQEVGDKGDGDLDAHGVLGAAEEV